MCWNSLWMPELTQRSLKKSKKSYVIHILPNKSISVSHPGSVSPNDRCRIERIHFAIVDDPEILDTIME